MRKKTLRMISSILTLVFLVSLFQAPMPVEAANTATIPVTVGGQTINVTPGQWVTVNTPGGSTSYNVRFVDGKPVALEMSQYTKLVFGDAASAAGASSNAGSTGNNTPSGAAGSNTGNAGTVDLGGSSNSGAAQTSTPAPQTSTGAAQTSGTAAQTSGSAAQTSGTTTTTTTTGSKPMTWNEFQKANAGKGMSGSEMGQAWQQYKQTNGVTSNSGSAAAQTSGSAAQTSTGAAQTSTPTPTTSVADGSAAAAQTTTTTTSTPAAQTSTGAAQASTPTTSVADGSAAAAQSSKTSTWNPAKHPRDPQTGKFISHEEAVARGLMDPADANISSNNSSSSQTAQAGTDSSAATQNAGAETTTASTETTATNGQAAQAAAGSDVAAASGDKTSKPTIGDKFKAGYETGKNLTNAGFQNVKDSLKSGFSAKNLLVTAGITVGVDLATQVMRGENPSLKSALKTVCCAEFVGGVAGSVIGSAAGSFFVPFLSCIPVVGGALSALAPAFGSIVGSSVGAYTAGDLKNGRFSIKEAFKRIDWVGVTGQAIGSTVGAALGSCLGPVGTVLGGMVGGYFGNWAAQKIAGLFGKGNANLPVVATPVGTSGNNITTAGTVTIGGADVTSVSVSNDIPVVVADDNDEEKSEGMSGSDVEMAITEAYEEYTDLYTEYSQLIQAGKQQEAIEVAEKMNAAKAKYDELRKKG